MSSNESAIFAKSHKYGGVVGEGVVKMEKYHQIISTLRLLDEDGKTVKELDNERRTRDVQAYWKPRVGKIGHFIKIKK